MPTPAALEDLLRQELGPNLDAQISAIRLPMDDTLEVTVRWRLPDGQWAGAVEILGRSMFNASWADLVNRLVATVARANQANLDALGTRYGLTTDRQRRQSEHDAWVGQLGLQQRNQGLMGQRQLTAQGLLGQQDPLSNRLMWQQANQQLASVLGQSHWVDQIAQRAFEASKLKEVPKEAAPAAEPLSVWDRLLEDDDLV